MYEETFETGERYTRLEESDMDIIGKRVNGHGKIKAHIHTPGDRHPDLLRTEDGCVFTPDELRRMNFDGRHGEIAW